MGGRTTAAKSLPFGLDLGGDLEGGRGPAISLFCRRHLGGIGQSAMALRGVLGGMAQGDMGFARNHRRARAGFCSRKRCVNRHRIVAIAFKHIPARSRKARLLIGDVRKRDLAVDGDAVVVPHHDQTRQRQLACKANRLLADALHQAAVAGHDIGVMVLHLGTPARAQVFFGNRKANRIGNALTQGAGGGLDTCHMAIFGMACGDRAPLAKILDLRQRHILVAGQIKQRIDQHRAMARRQNKAIPIGPTRRLGVKLQVLFKQDRSDIGHAHRHARVAGVCSGNGI